MADHLIERLVEPVTAQVRGWLKTRALRAELHALPAAERESVLREIGFTESSIDRLVADHPGPDKFLPKRLDDVGLDAGYLKHTHAATFRDMERVCSTCPDWKTCRSDIQRADAVKRLNEYCPNTHTIDCLIAGENASIPLPTKG